MLYSHKKQADAAFYWVPVIVVRVVALLSVMVGTCHGFVVVVAAVPVFVAVVVAVDDVVTSGVKRSSVPVVSMPVMVEPVKPLPGPPPAPAPLSVPVVSVPMLSVELAAAPPLDPPHPDDRARMR
jgi:hypothetical protein